MVSLRADIGDPQEHILRQLALDGEVVLLGVLRFQVRLKFPEVDRVPEIGPIHAAGGAARRSHGAGVCGVWLITPPKRIRRLRAIDWPRNGKLKRVVVSEGAAAEGWLGAELLEDELFDRIVEDAKSSADARLARTAGELGEPAVCPPRTPSETDTRSEGFVVGAR